VKLGQASRMAANATKEILEMQAKVAVTDNLRMQLQRLRLKHAQANLPAEHGLGTRTVSEQKKNAEAQGHLSEVAHLLATAASACEAAQGQDFSASLEGLLPQDETVPRALKADSAADALNFLIRFFIAGHNLTPSDVVSSVSGALPVSFMSEAGNLLNRDVRFAGRATSGSTWRERWINKVSSRWHAFSASLLSTRSQKSSTTSAYRDNEIIVRASTIYFIVAFTLDPKDTALMQAPLASLMNYGSTGAVLGVLNTMGVSISERKVHLDAPTRVAQSKQLLFGLLGVWMKPFSLSTGVICQSSIRIHIDNWDLRDMHLLLVGLTVLDPPPVGAFVRRRIADLRAEDLVQLSPEEIEAERQQLRDRASRATHASTDVASEARVLALVMSERAVDIHLAEQNARRLSTKLGPRADTVPASSAPLASTLIASSDFDGGPNYSYYTRVSFNKGDVLKLILLLPERGLAVVEKGEGKSAATGYAPLSSFEGYVGSAKAAAAHLHSPIEEKRSCFTLGASVPQPLNLCAETDNDDASCIGRSLISNCAMINEARSESCNEEATRLKGTDAYLLSATAAFLANHPGIPRPNLRASSLIVGLFDGKASSQRDFEAVVAKATAIITEVAVTSGLKVPLTTITVDGQEFLAEHTHRDKVMRLHQQEVDRCNREICLEEQCAEKLQLLQSRKLQAESLRDAVLDKPPVELGPLHTEFTDNRTIWKMNGTAALNGLADRVGLSHIVEHLRDCGAGFNKPNLEFFASIVEAWLTEMEVLRKEIGDSGLQVAMDVLSFIDETSKYSEAMMAYQGILCTNLTTVLDMHTACTKRGSEASSLLVSSQKRSLRLCAMGGGPNYVKNLLFSLRQRLICSSAHRGVMDSNPTTTIRETPGGQDCNSPDAHLESRMIKPSKDVLSGVHSSLVIAKGQELNATMGSKTALEANVGRGNIEHSREHRSRLDHGAMVTSARAAIRRFLVPSIRLSIQLALKSRHSADECSVSFSAKPSFPRIPTRAEELAGLAGRSNPGIIQNPEFVKSLQIAETRVMDAASRVLASATSAQTWPNLPVCSYELKPKGLALSNVKKQSERAMAVVLLLAEDPAAAAALNYPSCLSQRVGDLNTLNSGTKSHVRTALRSAFGGIAFWWQEGEGNGLLPRFNRIASGRLRIQHVAIDVPMVMRRTPQPPPNASTGADVVIGVISFILRPQLRKFPFVSWVEDLGGDLTKLPLEQKRDALRVLKAGAAGNSSQQRPPQQPFNLNVNLGPNLPKTFVPELYNDRTRRREWNAALGSILQSDDKELTKKLHEALGGSGVATFSGVGTGQDERSCTFQVKCTGQSGSWQPAIISEPSGQREDTHLLLSVVPTLLSGENAIIEAEDTDLLNIGILSICRLRKVTAAPLGQLFIRCKNQQVILPDGEAFDEQFICCSQLVDSIELKPSLQCVESALRVISVVALFILLGGDKTSYLCEFIACLKS
jgi:hypothetical protein